MPAIVWIAGVLFYSGMKYSDSKSWLDLGRSLLLLHPHRYRVIATRLRILTGGPRVPYTFRPTAFL